MAEDDVLFPRGHGLAQLVDEILSKPELRREFREDPFGLAGKAGINLDEIPERLVKTLAGLSVAELRLLTELNKVFIEEGMRVETGSTLMVY
jgi:hypothetical protein